MYYTSFYVLFHYAVPEDTQLLLLEQWDYFILVLLSSGA